MNFRSSIHFGEEVKVIVAGTPVCSQTNGNAEF